jgi:hypothetical protein
MSAQKPALHEVEKTIHQAEFIENPAKAFRLAGDGARVAIVSHDGKRRAILSVPQAELTFDGE